MVDQCPEKEFRLPDWITSYGVKRKVGEDTLRRFHRALCYLKEETELIDAKTGPLVKKIFTPEFHDPNYSYGYSVGSHEGRGAYQFSEDTSSSITVDFSDYETVRKYVDLRRTDAEVAVEEGRLRLPDYDETKIVEVVQHEMRSEKKVVYVETQVWTGSQWVTEQVPREVVVPVTHKDIFYENEPTEILKPIIGVPETEDITRGSNVEWRPGCKPWCKNTVIIAQTFKVPYDTTIKKVYLAVERPNGGGKPLYVGIVPTTTSGLPDLKIEDHRCPGLKFKNLLEYHKLDAATKGQSGDIAALDFSTPVKAGKTYALVIITDEEQSDQGWRVLGIQKNEIKDKDGNVVSKGWMYWNRQAGWQRLAGTRNGKSVTGSICFRIDGVSVIQQPKPVVKEWIEYVHQTIYEEVDVNYPIIETVLVPKEVEYTYDYYYTVQVPQTVTKYSDNRYIYLKPLKLNPVVAVTLKAQDARPTGASITYEVGVPSASGIAWFELNASNNYSKSFETPTTVLLFRARLQTSNESVTPSISKLQLSFVMEPAPEMFIVSEAYTPPLFGILAANVWTGVDFEYSNDPAVEIDALVAKNEFISYQEPSNYSETFQGDGETKVFELSHAPIFLGSETVKVNGVTKERNRDYTINYETGEITFNVAPDDEATVTVSYNIREIDLPVNEVLEGSVSLSLDSGDGSPATLYEYDDYFVDHKNAQVTLYKDLL